MAAGQSEAPPWPEIPGAEKTEPHIGEREIGFVGSQPPEIGMSGQRPQHRGNGYRQQRYQRRYCRRHGPAGSQHQQAGADEGEDVPVEGFLRQPHEHIEGNTQSEQKQASAHGALGNLTVADSPSAKAVGPDRVAHTGEKREQGRRKARW